MQYKKPFKGEYYHRNNFRIEEPEKWIDVESLSRHINECVPMKVH